MRRPPKRVRRGGRPRLAASVAVVLLLVLVAGAGAARAATVFDSPLAAAAAAPTAGQQKLCERYIKGQGCSLATLLSSCDAKQQAADCRDNMFVAWANAGKAKPKPTKPKTPAGRGQPPATGTSPGDVTFQPVPADTAPQVGGQVDPLGTLGLGSPFCSRTDISAKARANCQRSGAIESPYPVSSYGLDTNIKTGPTHIEGDIAAALQSAINMVWLAFLYLLRGILTVLEWAFSLDPFGPSAMPKIAATLGRIYRAIDSPWLMSAMSALGAWAAWHGIARRRHSAAFTGTLAAVAMIAVAMWIVHSPAQTVGYASSLSNQGALALIATTASGSVTNPATNFGDALSSVFQETVGRPWAALNFGDVSWALGKPEPDAVKAARAKASQDTQLQAAYLNAGGTGGADGLANYLGKLPAPKTRADLYLTYSPTSPPRDALWTYYHGKGDTSVGPISLGFGARAGKAPDKVAIQDPGGVSTRFALLALVLVGLAGVVMLLAWIALRLILQATVGFALLLAAPVALLFPAFGEHGRESFALWGKALLGALISKVIYASFLAVVVLGLGLIGSLGGTSWGLAWVLQAVFAWGVFLKRGHILNVASIGPDRRQDTTRAGLIGYLGYRLGRDLVKSGRRAVQRQTERFGARAAQREMERSAATRAHAGDTLADRADQMARVDLTEAGETLRKRDALRRDEQELNQTPQLRDYDTAKQIEKAGGPQAAVPLGTVDLVERREQVRQQLEELREPAKRAEALTQLAARNQQQFGTNLSEADRGERTERIRRELDLPASDEAHAWRVGMTREQFRELPDHEKQTRVREIEQQIAHDRELVNVVPTPREGAPQPTRVQERAVRERMGHGELRERRKVARAETRQAERQRRRHVPPRR